MRNHSLWFMLALGPLACGDDSTSATSDDGSSSSTSSSTTTDVTTSTQGSTSTDPATTTDATMSTTGPDETTGGANACGNGLVEVGEECDEGEDPDPWARCIEDCAFGYVEDWTVSYDGPAGGEDFFIDVAIDDAGNIYTAGRQTVTGEASNLIVKQYSSDGTEGWTYEYNGGGSGEDFAGEIAIHPSGDLIVVGSSTETDHGRSITTLRLTADGQTEVWMSFHDGPGTVELLDSANGLAVDGTGNIIVSGFVSVDDAGLDGIIVRYDADGNTLGTNEFAGSAGEDDSFFSVAATASGYVAVAIEETAPSQDDRHLIAFDASGTQTDDLLLDYTARDVAVDSSGNILVTGNSRGDGGDIVFVSYDSTLTEQWRTAYDGPSGDFDFGIGITTDGSGAVYAAGAATVIGQADDLWLGKVDASGMPRWSLRYNNEEASLNEFGESVAVGSDGSVVVVGSEVVLGQDRNGFMRRLTQP